MIESSLECEVCFIEYDSDEHRPKSLPCGHSICATCVKDNLKTKEGKMSCPFCRTSCGIGVKTLDDFPTTFALLNILNTSEQKSTQLLSPREKDKKILEQKKDAECDRTESHISNCNGDLQKLLQVKESQESTIESIRLKKIRLDEEEKQAISMKEQLDDFFAEGNDIVKGLEALRDRLRSTSSIPGFNMASQDAQRYYTASQEWSTSKVNSIINEDTQLTPEYLVKAVKEKNSLGVTLALQQGIDPNIRCHSASDKAGPLIFYAVACQFTDIVKALLGAKNIDLNLPGYQNNTALYEAVRNMNVPITKMLISKGADLDKASGGKGSTPLLRAIERGNYIMVEILIKHGASPNLASGQYGRTPLLASVVRDKINLVELLLENGASPNVASGDSARAPLAAAAQRGTPEICRLLLEHGAEPDARDGKGWFALYYAAGRGHQNVAKIILEFGGDPKFAMVGTRRTAAYYAQQKGHEAFAEWLLKQKKVSQV